MDAIVPTYHLISKHKNSFERELSLAIVEKVFKTRAKQINDHHIVVTLNTKPMNVWNANY